MHHLLENSSVLDLNFIEELVRVENLPVEIKITGQGDRLVILLEGLDHQVGWIVHLFKQAKEQRDRLTALLPLPVTV